MFPLAIITGALREDHQIKKKMIISFCWELRMIYRKMTLPYATHTNIIVSTLPYSYDKHESSFENKLIKSVYRAITKLISIF